MAMKKHISVHHVYLFDKEYTSAAEPGAELRSESAVDDTLQCQVCDLWFEEEFGLANHYSREHFDRIRGVGDESTEVVAAAEEDVSESKVAKVGGEILAIRNLSDDAEDKEGDGAKNAEKSDKKSSGGDETSINAADDAGMDSVTSDEADRGEVTSATTTTAASDTTPRRSSRRHALKNMNPQHVRPQTDEAREPSCGDNSRDGISRNVNKAQDGNEVDASGNMGRVSKGDSEEVDDDSLVMDDADKSMEGGEKVEGEAKGAVKEEGTRDLEGEAATGRKVEEESVEISPAKKGGLQCPLCPSSCNYRSLLLNHIKKFHPGELCSYSLVVGQQ